MAENGFFSSIREHFLSKLPFVVYFDPDPAGMGRIKALLQKDSVLNTVKGFTESGFVFAPFDDKKEAIVIPENASEMLFLEQQDFNRSEGDTPMPEGDASNQKQSHIQLVEKAVEAVKDGEMEKVVLSRREEVALTEEDPLSLFMDLLGNYPLAFVYCWYHPEIGLWMGATPETLLKVEGKEFETMALAGTQKFDGTEEVEWKEKERQEQQFVTDSILSNLEEIEAFQGRIKVSEPYTSKAGNLLHLRTDISGRLKTVENLKEIIYSLHPTPAVCGLPKEKTKKFILQKEGYDREFYTGFLGELNVLKSNKRSKNSKNVENLAYSAVKKQTSLFVNLRCMKLEDGKAVLFIGGGITKDSIPEDEWEETVNKAQTMKKVLI